MHGYGKGDEDRETARKGKTARKGGTGAAGRRREKDGVPGKREGSGLRERAHVERVGRKVGKTWGGSCRRG